VTYLVFEVWLKSQLPRGIFPWWWQKAASESNLA